MNYAKAYDLIMSLQEELAEQLRADTGATPDFRTVQALAATYTLQDYTAAKIAELGLDTDSEIEP